MKKYEDAWMISCYDDDHDENNDDDNRWGVFIHRWTCLLQGHMRLRSLHSLTIQRCTDVVDDWYINSSKRMEEVEMIMIMIIMVINHR